MQKTAILPCAFFILQAIADQNWTGPSVKLIDEARVPVLETTSTYRFSTEGANMITDFKGSVSLKK